MARSSSLAIVALAAVIASSPLGAQSWLVLKGATVIDGTGREPMPNATVVVRNGRIESVSAGPLPVPKGARVLDLTGRYLLPGFIDMHAHLAMGPITMASKDGQPMLRMDYDSTGSAEMAATALAFGVTTVRNPGGPTAEAVALRDAIRLGRLRGPRIFTAGSILDAAAAPGLGVAVPTEAAVRAEVDRQADAGVDYIKLYAGLNAPLLRAGIDEAHRRGLKAIGHLFATTWTDAANAGIDGIVHITPGNPTLLPAAKRAEFAKSFRGTQFMLSWFNYVDVDGAEIRDLLTALTTHHVNLDPTLVIFEAMARGDDPAVTESPDLRYAPPSLVRGWRTFTLTTGWSAADFREARASWPQVLRFTKTLFDAGVLLTVGTDLSNPWVPPGTSFHRELELLVSAGIAPKDVLGMATRNGAQALGILSDVGTIQAGKRADLVVLSADPLADIRNTRRIEWVVQDGRPARPADLLPARLGGKKE